MEMLWLTVDVCKCYDRVNSVVGILYTYWRRYRFSGGKTVLSTQWSCASGSQTVRQTVTVTGRGMKRDRTGKRNEKQRQNNQ